MNHQDILPDDQVHSQKPQKYEISDEMIAAGVDAAQDWTLGQSLEDLVFSVYLSMKGAESNSF